MSKTHYIIKEKWKVAEEIERYEQKKDNIADVKKYIKEWIESWKENAKENEYKIEKIKTNEKTYAQIVINTGYRKDFFYLKVLRLKGSDKE